MFKLLRQIFQVGEATVQYPFAPLAVAPDLRGKPEYNAEQCVACAACALACPPNAIRIASDVERGTRTWTINFGRCIYCARCEEVCPTGAIRLSPNFELAVMSKADLFEQAEFRLTACRVCGRYFAPEKEIAYALALLKQAKLPRDGEAERRAVLETCPECRRKEAAEKPAISDGKRGQGQRVITPNSTTR
jgi:hydrogenase-4 component H